MKIHGKVALVTGAGTGVGAATAKLLASKGCRLAVGYRKSAQEAEGVVAAADELGIGVPLVVRLQGTNAEEGRAILAKSGLDITPAETLQEAGERAVAAAAGDVKAG